MIRGARHLDPGPGNAIVRKMTARWFVLVAAALAPCPAAQSRPPAATPTAGRTVQPPVNVPEPADWAGLARYRDDNARLGLPHAGETRVVFLGDSITEGWAATVPAFFAGHPWLDRGVSGQTTSQMLVRFRQDVIALHPRVVVILGGTNDIAGNGGPYSPQATLDNLSSMIELARAHGIGVVLASLPPALDFPWRPGLHPAAKITALNARIRALAARSGAVYLDYHTAMANARGGLRNGLSGDGVHPNAAGYAVMAPLAEAAIKRALHHPD
jgi:acyl-CoA thioesterase-1